MLEQKYRFHGHGSLRYLNRHGQNVRGRSLAIRYAHNPRRAHNRCTVVISRKVIKSAPKRNRVRRRVYEVIRLNWHHFKTPYDFAITVYDPHFFDMPYIELEKQIVATLRKTQLWLSSQNTVKTDS